MGDWKLLGEGSFNYAYVNRDKTQVLKIQKEPDLTPTDTPERSVRLWNEVNPHISPEAVIGEKDGQKGWVCPYIKGEQASDEETSEALIDIYEKTGRIVIDALSPKNFLKTDTGQVVCVDIGQALQLEKAEEDSINDARRRRSTVSLETWRGLFGMQHEQFRNIREAFPKTVDTIRALLYLKATRPDISDLSFLKGQRESRELLAREYERGVTVRTCGTVKRYIDEHRPMSLQSLKDSCITELNRYISSRGKINPDGQFTPSMITKIFRNRALTLKKVQAAQTLIESIQKAENLGEIKKIIQAPKDDVDYKKSSFTSELMVSLGRCEVNIKVGENIISDDKDREDVKPHG